MLERLEYVRLTPELVIDAGCGTGHALPGLAGRFPDARLLAIDCATTMLAQARYATSARVIPGWMRRWLGVGQVQAVAADFDHLPLAASSVGCIWSNLALHWAADLSATDGRAHV